MFNFNPYSGLLLIGFVQGVVFTVLLLVRAYREERWSDGFAAGVLAVGTVYVAQWMLGFAGWYDGRDVRTTFMFYAVWDHLAALGPLIYLYFRAATNTDFRWRRRYWWHFLPYGLILLQPLAIFLYDWGYYRLLRGEVFEFFSGSRGPAAEWDNRGDGILYYLTYLAVRLHLIAYLMYTVRYYRAYRRYVDREFSNPDPVRFRDLGWLLGLLLAGLGITLLLELISNLTGGVDYVAAWYRYFVMSVLVFAAAIGLYGNGGRVTRRLRFAATDPAPVPPSYGSELRTASAPPEPIRDEAEVLRWKPRLEAQLREHADYLNPELKLGDLAAALGTNASVLSRVINAGYGLNFNDFINARRCAAFLERVDAGDHERHTLLSLALDSGFNSKSTFNRAFRKCYGYSPGEAIKRTRS